MIRVVIAEDHQMVREGFRALLAAEPDVHVVGGTGDGAHAVALVKAYQPDVLVTDLTLPTLDGFEVVRQAVWAVPTTAAVVLSMHGHSTHVAQAVRAGASGYVLKEAGADDLIAAIRTVQTGGRFFSAGLTDPNDESTSESDRYATLTPREREVVALTVEGLTAAEAAKRLFLSPRTIESHRQNAMGKLGVRSRAELVRYVVERGIIP